MIPEFLLEKLAFGLSFKNSVEFLKLNISINHKANRVTLREIFRN